MAARRRPLTASAALFLQGIITLTIVAGILWLLVTAGPMIDAEKHPWFQWVGLSGILITVAFVVIPSLALWSLARGSARGWWVCIVLDTLLTANALLALVVNVLGDPGHAFTTPLVQGTIALFFLAPVVLLLSPQSRQYFTSDSSPSLTAATYEGSSCQQP